MIPAFADDHPQARRRLALAATLALLVHGALLWGIRYRPPAPSSEQAVLSLNISLVERSGGRPVAALPATPEGRSQPTLPAEPKAEPAPEPVAPQQPDPEPVVPDRSTPRAQPQQPPPPQPARPAPRPGARELINSGLALARQGELTGDTPTRFADRDRQQLSALDAASVAEGFYRENWVRKVQRVGELNFPPEASRLDLSRGPGPTLAVVVRADGTLQSVRVHRSSGYPALDEAAVRIVRLAAPYAPFPPELRHHYDILSITRRWIFEPGTLRSD
ncbi:MAG: TonB family protein [Candidatus Competibacteraceae bacterium]|nr:TonB family protein [Candidatus Competibacteraceae bacterium]